MSTNKYATIRYQALDRCFRNKHRRFYIEDLIEACNEAVYNYTGIDPDVKKRQVYNDIAFMRSEQGWDAPIETKKDDKRTYYFYDEDFSINERPMTDDEIDILTQAIAVLGRFKGLPQFDWIDSMLANLQDKFYMRGNNRYVIGFEQNLDYLAATYLSDLFQAIVNKQTLHVKYKTFKGVELEWIIHPYFIKQYNNRWFLFGLNNNEYRNITNIPLDRIVSIERSDVPYINNDDIDFDEYFDDVVGVTINQGKPVETVVLHFTPERLPFVESKPIHGSMRIKDREQGVVDLRVIPNKELESLILSFGDQVEVLEPVWLREQVKHKIDALAKKYSSCAHQMHT